MTESNLKIMNRVLSALEGFFEYDRDLLYLGASERSITHKLAEHLQREFIDWNVDCEYNRFGKRKNTKKTLPRILFGPLREDDDVAKTIFPDIVVHKRTLRENLLVIEAKKSNSGISEDTDIKKLKAFTDQNGDYGYRLGLFLVFDVEMRKISKVKCFECGREVELPPDVLDKMEALGYGE